MTIKDIIKKELTVSVLTILIYSAILILLCFLAFSRHNRYQLISTSTRDILLSNKYFVYDQSTGEVICKQIESPDKKMNDDN